MLKNMNDILTLVTLLLMTGMTVRLISGLFTDSDKDADHSFWTYLKNYQDNEED